MIVRHGACTLDVAVSRVKLSQAQHGLHIILWSAGRGGGGAGRGVWRRFKNVISLRCHKQSFKNNYFLISKGVQIGLTLCNSARAVEISFDCKSSLCLPLAVLYKQEMTFFREKKKHKKKEREREK